MENNTALSASIEEGSYMGGGVYTATDCQVLMLDREKVVTQRKRYWFVRRLQDVILCSIALIVLSPIMLISAIAIVLDDPQGGSIFSQKRVGRDGKLFKMYKFRTMCVDAESRLHELMAKNEQDGPAFKIQDDPRITRVGRILRKTSIDELPQLINIIKGDMTIVGPRPALPSEVERYTQMQRQRLYVTPGLTCYWQIQPHRNKISFSKWIELDLQYIRERSFVTDWKIILLTIRAVLFGWGL